MAMYVKVLVIESKVGRRTWVKVFLRANYGNSRILWREGTSKNQLDHSVSPCHTIANTCIFDSLNTSRKEMCMLQTRGENYIHLVSGKSRPCQWSKGTGRDKPSGTKRKPDYKSGKTGSEAQAQPPSMWSGKRLTLPLSAFLSRWVN